MGNPPEQEAEPTAHEQLDEDSLAVCLSLQSMMSSAKKKSRPPDNEMTSRLAQGQDPREMAWHPHDDEC